MQNFSAPFGSIYIFALSFTLCKKNLGVSMWIKIELTTYGLFEDKINIIMLYGQYYNMKHNAGTKY